MKDDVSRVHQRPRSLLDLPASEWRSMLGPATDAGYRGDQVANWVFQHGVFRFADMVNLPARCREELSAGYAVAPPRVAARFESVDGTRRFLLELDDGLVVESVYMPYPDRVTLCISSQVGCRFDCGFCQTGQMGLQRSLSAGEIVGQVLRLRAEQGSLDRTVNVVFMGQGEPLDNVDQVEAALVALQDPQGPLVCSVFEHPSRICNMRRGWATVLDGCSVNPETRYRRPEARTREAELGAPSCAPCRPI